MIVQPLLRRADIVPRVRRIISEELGTELPTVQAERQLLADVLFDSLDLTELFLTLEEEFDISFDGLDGHPLLKAIFTRDDVCVADFAELVFVFQDRRVAPQRSRRRSGVPIVAETLPFTQLDGRWETPSSGRLLESMGVEHGVEYFRRRSDGMRCALIPAAEVELGSESPKSDADERPLHQALLDAFLIDAEPVSTLAYCRFLNSIDEPPPDALSDWFVLDPADHRREFMPIERRDGEWTPISGTERLPMVLVSWYGANAYALWANGGRPEAYRHDAGSAASHLPTEAQWEYAARGASRREFPWGDEPPTQERARFGLHFKGQSYRGNALPMAPVNEASGVSPFGVVQMAGNVWQWCQDWYDPEFYSRPTARQPNPLNSTPAFARVERGGSWVGPAELCRSSRRRGRNPFMRGRCLGFRCSAPVPA